VERERIEVVLSPEVYEDLLKHNVDIMALLSDSRFDWQPTYGNSGSNEERAVAKEPAIIVLATAAAVVAATPILRDIVSALSRRPVAIRRQRLVTVRGTDGSVIVGSDGEPLREWRDEVLLVSPPGPKEATQKLAVSGPWAIRIEYESTR
jgi:hypothetical protein